MKTRRMQFFILSLLLFSLVWYRWKKEANIKRQYQRGLTYEEIKDYDSAIRMYQSIRNNSKWVRLAMERVKICKEKKKEINKNVLPAKEGKKWEMAASFENFERKMPKEEEQPKASESRGYSFFDFAKEMKAQGSSIDHILQDIGMLINLKEPELTQTPHPLFLWEDIYKNKGYTLEIAKDYLFTEDVIAILNIKRKSHQLVEYSLTNGIYYWRVEADNGAYSDIGCFEISLAPDPQPLRSLTPK